MIDPKYDDPMKKPADWDQEAYDEAKHTWEEWQKSQSGQTDTEDEQHRDEQERLKREEKLRQIVQRHQEKKRLRREAWSRYKEEKPTEEEPHREEETRLSWQEEYRMEKERIAREGGDVYSYTFKLLAIFMGLVGILVLIGNLICYLLI